MVTRLWVARGCTGRGCEGRVEAAAVHDDKARDEEDEGAEGDEDDAADVSDLAALEDGAAMEQLDDNNVEGDNGATKSCDVILEEGVGLEERGVVVHHVEQRLPHFRCDLGRRALDSADVTCDLNQ